MRKSSIPVSTHKRSASTSRLSTTSDWNNATRPRRSSSLQRQSSVHSRVSLLPKHGLSSGRPSRPSRESGYSLKGEARLAKDPRPLADKEFQNEAVANLVNFLNEHGYSSCISVKTFANLTKTEFGRIFEFMYTIFDPRFKGFSGSVRMEDEVPKLLKNLRYPFILQRSSIMTMGARHSWPAILGMLTWMADMTNYALSINVHDVMFTGSEFDSNLRNKHVLEHILGSYRKHLNNEPDADNFTKVFDDYSSTGDTEELVKTIPKLQEEYREVENRLKMQQEEWAEIEQEYQNYEKAKAECDAYIASMHPRIEDMEEHLNALKIQLENLILNKQHLDEEICKARDEAKEQQHYAKENEELSKEIDHLEMLITSEAKNLSEVTSELWQKDVALKSIDEQCAEECRQFNSKYNTLKSAVASAKDSPAMEYLGSWVKFDEAGNMPGEEIQPTATKEDFMHIQKIREAVEKQHEQWQAACAEADHILCSKHQNLKEIKLQQKESEHQLDLHKSHWLCSIEELKSGLMAIERECDTLRKLKAKLHGDIEATNNDIKLLSNKIKKTTVEKQQAEMALKKVEDNFEQQYKENVLHLNQLKKSIEDYATSAKGEFDTVQESVKAMVTNLRKDKS